jgi:hypothetical protein
MKNTPRVVCLECGSMVSPVVEKDGMIYYSPHYIPGRADSTGFCSNISKVPPQILNSALREGRGGK